jgi:hypothetical protein
MCGAKERVIVPMLAFLSSALLLGATLAPQGEERGLRRVEVSPATSVELSLAFETGEGANRRLLASGDALHSRDRFRLRVGASSVVHLYVLQFFADGTANLLHPEGDDARLQPGVQLDILLELDDSPGEEHLYIVASVLPLEEVDEAVARRIEEVRMSGGEAPVPPRRDPLPVAAPEPAPRASAPRRQERQGAGERQAAEEAPQLDLLGLGTRGVVRVRPDRTLEALSDDAGVAIYHFWLRHLRAP